MRDVKLVAYGSLSDEDERLITNYLEEKEFTVQFLSVDTQRNRIDRQVEVIAQQNDTLSIQGEAIADQRAYIEELEKRLDIPQETEVVGDDRDPAG